MTFDIDLERNIKTLSRRRGWARSVSSHRIVTILSPEGPQVQKEFTEITLRRAP